MFFQAALAAQGYSSNSKGKSSCSSIAEIISSSDCSDSEDDLVRQASPLSVSEEDVADMHFGSKYYKHPQQTKCGPEQMQDKAQTAPQIPLHPLPALITTPSSLPTISTKQVLNMPSLSDTKPVDPFSDTITNQKLSNSPSQIQPIESKPNALVNETQTNNPPHIKPNVINASPSKPSGTASLSSVLPVVSKIETPSKVQVCKGTSEDTEDIFDKLKNTVNSKVPSEPFLIYDHTAGHASAKDKKIVGPSSISTLTPVLTDDHPSDSAKKLPEISAENVICELALKDVKNTREKVKDAEEQKTTEGEFEKFENEDSDESSLGADDNLDSGSSSSSPSPSSSSDSSPSTPVCDLDLDVFLGKTSDTDLDLLVQTAAATAVRPEPKPKPKPSASRAANRKSFSVRDILGGKRNLVSKVSIPSETMKPVEASPTLDRTSPTHDGFETTEGSHATKKSSRGRRDVSHEVASLKDALTSEPTSARRTRKPAITEGVDLSQFRAVRKKKDASVERNEGENTKSGDSIAKRGRPKKGAKVTKKTRGRKANKTQLRLSESDSDDDENDEFIASDDQLKRAPEKIKTKILGNIFSAKKAVRPDESRVREGTIMVVKEDKPTSNDGKTSEFSGPMKRGRKKLVTGSEMSPTNDEPINKSENLRRKRNSTLQSVERGSTEDKSSLQLSLSESDEEPDKGLLKNNEATPDELEETIREGGLSMTPDNGGKEPMSKRPKDISDFDELFTNTSSGQSNLESDEPSRNVPTGQIMKSRGRQQTGSPQEKQNLELTGNLGAAKRRGRKKLEVKPKMPEMGKESALENAALSIVPQDESSYNRETRRLRPKVELDEATIEQVEADEAFKEQVKADEGTKDIVENISAHSTPSKKQKLVENIEQKEVPPNQSDLEVLKQIKRTRTDAKVSEEIPDEKKKLLEEEIRPVERSEFSEPLKIGKCLKLV